MTLEILLACLIGQHIGEEPFNHLQSSEIRKKTPKMFMSKFCSAQMSALKQENNKQDESHVFTSKIQILLKIVHCSSVSCMQTLYCKHPETGVDDSELNFFCVYRFKPESANSLTFSAIAMHRVRTIGFAVRCSSAYHPRTCNQFHFVRKCGTISE